MERRLAAILAADVVGYTRLMGADEAGTLQRLNQLRQDILEPLIAEHRGRVVKLVGDGLLVEFVSVVGAVNCALAWQERVSRHEADRPSDTRLRFRIGINLGDVIAENDDIHGDGVNVAARMEALAEPDGICLSDDAYRQTRGKVRARFVDLGEQNLKNVAFPVRVYRVTGNRDETEPGLLPQEPLALPDKPSIVVLPFTNKSGDAEQEYVADGITEDIITELSRFSGLFVIARNSSFAYKGQSVDVTQVAQELGVRYLLEGSLRRGGNRLRITAQLLDRVGGGHVWREKYDGHLEDIFELQDEITRSVVSSIAPRIELAELERSRKLSGSSLTAYELALKAQALSYDALRVADPKILDQAESVVGAALALDPRHSHALWTKSLIYFYRHMYRWGDNPDGALKACAKTAEILVHVDSANAKAYMVRAWARLYQRKFDAALADHHRALELNPNLASNLFAMSWSEAVSGLLDEAKTHALMAIRLSPRETDIWMGEGYAAVALACFFEGDYAEAVNWGQRAYQMQPMLQGLMAAAHAYLGDLESARSHAETIRSFAPEFLDAVLSGEIEVCKMPDHNKLFVDGLRKASAYVPCEP